MKQTLTVGACGWRHQHWSGDFYPEDLPQEWQLSYYSNEFDAVMLPASYWSDGTAVDCGQWLDDVHEKFRFYIECRASMLLSVPAQKLRQQLALLQPQLAALVFIGQKHDGSAGDEAGEDEKAERVFRELANRLQVALLKKIPAGYEDSQWPVFFSPDSSHSLVIADSDISDLRQAKQRLDACARRLPDTVAEAGIIVDYPGLKAGDLAALRGLLEIMEY